MKDVQKDLGTTCDALNETRGEVKRNQADLKTVLEDTSDMKVSHAELKGELHALDNKLTGMVGALEQKLTGMIGSFEQHATGRVEALEERLTTFITNMRERKLDTNERGKIGIGGLVATACIAAASLMLSLITLFK